MKRVDLGYPWGTVEVPQGLELVELEAACGAEDHFSHPFCDPRWEEEVEALRGRVLCGPIYTDGGWAVLVAVPKGSSQGGEAE